MKTKTKVVVVGGGVVGVSSLYHLAIKGLSDDSKDNTKVENEVKKEVIELCSKFPIYKNLK